MSDSLPWLIAALSLAALIGLGLWWALRERFASRRPLPRHWALSARPVFSQNERRLYRQLREALPQHVVLSKLPLVRICQPNDPGRVGYWYGLLGAIHVGFLVCSPAGRALAAIDLEDGRPPSRRTQQIKQEVLAACGIRHIRCKPDSLLSIPEIQMLVPPVHAAGRSAPTTPVPRGWVSGEENTVSAAGDRISRWKHSGFSQEQLFGADGFSDTRAETRVSEAASVLARQGPGTVADIRALSPREVGALAVEPPPQRH